MLTLKFTVIFLENVLKKLQSLLILNFDLSPKIGNVVAKKEKI